jgi:hypothetical protein
MRFGEPYCDGGSSSNQLSIHSPPPALIAACSLLKCVHAHHHAFPSSRSTSWRRRAEGTCSSVRPTATGTAREITVETLRRGANPPIRDVVGSPTPHVNHMSITDTLDEFVVSGPTRFLMLNARSRRTAPPPRCALAGFCCSSPSLRPLLSLSRHKTIDPHKTLLEPRHLPLARACSLSGPPCASAARAGS